MKRQALRCMLSDKARQDRLVCLDSTDTIDGKTKSMAQLLLNLSVAGSALVVTMGSDRNVVLAAHNLKKIWTIPVHQLNAQELLARDMVIMTVEAARWAEETLAAEPHGRRGAKWAYTASVAPVSNGSTVAELAMQEAPAEEVLATEAPDIEAADTLVEEPAASPRPRHRSTARTAEDAATDAPAEMQAEEEAPTPRPRRRRSTASSAGDDAPETTAETPAEQEAPTPRPRRSRTAASAEPESAAEAPNPGPESPDPDEEA